MKATNVRAFKVLAIPLMAGVVAALVLAFAFGGAERAVAQETQNEKPPCPIANPQPLPGPRCFQLSITSTSTVTVGEPPNQIIDTKCTLVAELSMSTDGVFDRDKDGLIDVLFQVFFLKGMLDCPNIPGGPSPVTLDERKSSGCAERLGSPEEPPKEEPIKCDELIPQQNNGERQELDGGPSQVILDLFLNVDNDILGKLTNDFPHQVVCPRIEESPHQCKVERTEFRTVSGQPAGTITNSIIVATEIPEDGVGGFFTELAGDGTGLPLEAAQSSGTNAGLLAGVIAAISAVAITVTGAAWYARRRWVS